MGREIVRQYGMPDQRQFGGDVDPLGSPGKDIVTGTAKFVCGTMVGARGGRIAAVVAAELCGQGAGFLYGQIAPRLRQFGGFSPQRPLPPPRQEPPAPVPQPPAPPPRQEPPAPIPQPPTPPPPSQSGNPPIPQPQIPPPPRQLYGHYDRDQGSWLADSFEGALRFAEFVASGGANNPGFVEGPNPANPDGGGGGGLPGGLPSATDFADRILKSVLPHELNVHWLARKLGSELQKFLGLGQTKIDKQKENIQDFFTAMFRFFDQVLPSFQVNDNHALQFKSKGVKRELGQRPDIAALAPSFRQDAGLLATVGIGYDKSGQGVEERLVNQFLANAANSGWTVDQTKAYWQAVVFGAKEARK